MLAKEMLNIEDHVSWTIENANTADWLVSVPYRGFCFFISVIPNADGLNLSFRPLPGVLFFYARNIDKMIFSQSFRPLSGVLFFYLRFFRRFK